MHNHLILLGRLGNDPELKNVQGLDISLFSVATSFVFFESNGSKKEEVQWFRVVTYKNMALSCSKFLKKGSTVFVEGRLRTKRWKDKEGKDQYLTEVIAKRVIFLDKKEKEERPNEGQTFDDSDIPF